MKTKTKVLITCEHGGAKIPPAFKSRFRTHSSLLRTHRGSDMGALELAKSFAKRLRAPLDLVNKCVKVSHGSTYCNALA